VSEKLFVQAKVIVQFSDIHVQINLHKQLVQAYLTNLLERVWPDLGYTNNQIRALINESMNVSIGANKLFKLFNIKLILLKI